jgi:hypothetical protein
MATYIDEVISEIASRQANLRAPEQNQPISGGGPLLWTAGLNLAVILGGSWLLGQQSLVPTAHAMLLFCGSVISFITLCWVLYRFGKLQRYSSLQEETLQKTRRELADARSRTRETIALLHERNERSGV